MPITEQQIAEYQNRFLEGVTDQQKKDIAIAVYQDLYDKGYNYAGWALGVAKGNSVTGLAALEYLADTALFGLGNDAVCRNLSNADVDRIRVQMALNTLEKMQQLAKNSAGILRSDLTFNVVQEIHKKTFEDNRLSLSNWTLQTPMLLYRKAYGDDAVERLWVGLRETGGDGIDGVMASTLLVGAVGRLAFTSTDREIRQQALEWMEKVPGTSDAAALWRSTKLIGKWLGISIETIGDFNLPAIADAPRQLISDQQLIEGIVQRLATQAINQDAVALGLESPTRNSAALIAKSGLHVAQFREGGTVDDLWLVEKNAGRYQGSRIQFRSDFAASNGSVDGKTLLVQQGQPYFVPERSADGTTTYHYSNGAVVANNAATGEYRMVVPNTDGSGGQTVYTRKLGADGYTVRQVSTTAAGKILYEQESVQATRDAELSPVKTVSVVDGQTTRRDWFSDAGYQTDTYRDASGSPVSSAIQLGKTSYDLYDPSQRAHAEYQLSSLHDDGRLGQRYWLDFSSLTTRWLLGASGGLGFNPAGELGFKLPAGWSDPIGAFYDSQSASYDRSASIALATVRAMSATGQALSASQLAALDVNRDGQVSTGEAGALRLWADSNEDGQLGSSELMSVTRNISRDDYGFLTRGSGRVVANAMSMAPPPAHTRSEPAYAGVPPSNDQELRKRMQVYPMFQGIFLWKAGEIMLGWNRNQYDYMIGTNGDDRFDVNYFAAAPAYLSRYTGRVRFFMAGAGNDVMGGSDRADTLWGGTGNDTLYGYAGADLLYGEEGDDTVLGHDGNDQLDGGAGNDLLLGGAGEDLVWGGEGADELQGNEGNDLLLGQAGNDRLYGQAGNDTLWGGDGADDLQGNEGGDALLGGAGNDRLFGQLGNDLLIGGDGDDVLVGFMASNEARQGLAAGESDDDVLQGGAGNDNLFGGPGDDQLSGESGRDLLLGDEGQDSLWGGSDDDELQGGTGNDQMDGGSGHDKLFDQAGNDRLWGGEGNDLLIGFTASNDPRQTLLAGETDDDVLYGGTGSDVLIGGVGMDQLYGGDDRDELQGGAGDDMLMGEGGNDNLFGQAGNDTLYGGEGDDYLQGFTASNESQQRLAAGETDDDFLYGGAGTDILVGGVGSDYLDGGAGADTMVGGKGDDVYIVNSANDTVYEQEGEGYDTVITSSNYLLNAHIEELRLLEGYRIHATGNALDNTLIGNSADNILDGVTGADLMRGGAGNDTYYVDNAGDVVSERAGEGRDMVQSSVSYRLGTQVEDLLLLDFSKPEKGAVDGRNVLVYGYPKRNELDYMQGDAVDNYTGTCALTSIANLLTQAGRPTTEAQVVRLAINNNWTVSNPALPAHQLGGTNVEEQRKLLSSYGLRNDVVIGYNEMGMANLLRSGRGVILAVNAGLLWGEDAYKGNGAVNHAVTLTGAVIGESDGALLGFYLADSGRGRVSDMTRFVDIASLRRAADQPNAYAIHTLEPVKYWQENIDATGNELANNIVGNRGNNVLQGMAGDDVLSGAAGDDTLTGGAGNDRLDGGSGDDTYRYAAGDGADVIQDADGNDTLLLGDGISATSARTTVQSGRLTLFLEGGSVEMEAKAGKLVDRIQFTDGTVWHARADGSGYVQILGGPLHITGDLKQGQTVSLDTTLAKQEGPGKVSSRWERSANGIDWTVIAGATEALLLLSADLVGHRLRAIMQSLLEDGKQESLVSAVSETVGRSGQVPVEAVRISGELMPGDPLAVSNTAVDMQPLWSADALGSVLTVAQAPLGKLAIPWDHPGALGRSIVSSSGHDYLAGTAGADRLVGLQGHDEYIVNHVGDVIVEALFEGIDRVYASVSHTLSDNVESLTLTGTMAIDGSGNEGPNSINGNQGDNRLSGGGGNDTLHGGAGSDTLDGGPDNDWLDGGTGSDIYLFGRGSGEDTINEADRSAAARASMDVVLLGPGIAQDDLHVSRNRWDDLILNVVGTPDKLMLSGWFAEAGSAIDQIRFRDGAVWNAAKLTERSAVATRHDDYLVGTGGPDRLEGLAGDDTYVVNHAGDVIVEKRGEGVDKVMSSVSFTLTPELEHLELTGNGDIDGRGNAGANRILGDWGRNVLDGGAGDDYLAGGGGGDTYLFGPGSGTDIIDINDGDGTDDDRIRMGAGVIEQQIWLSRVDEDLELSLFASGDKLSFKEWFADGSKRWDRIELSNGRWLGAPEVDALVSAMAAFAPPLVGQAALTSSYQAALGAVIAASWH